MGNLKPLKNVLVAELNKTGPPNTRWIDVVTKDLAMIDQNATLETAYQRDGRRF